LSAELAQELSFRGQDVVKKGGEGGFDSGFIGRFVVRDEASVSEFADLRAG
jgi:hypothetical protein